MEQIITWPQIPQFVLGVSEPILLGARADTGRRIVYSVDEEKASLDGIELLPKVTGTITVTATASAHGEYDEASSNIEIEVIEGDYFARAETLAKIRKQLDADISVLNQVAKISISDVQSLLFKMDVNGAAVIKVNELPVQSITIQRMVKKFINSSTQFWENEIVKEEQRLAELITDHKQLNP